MRGLLPIVVAVAIASGCAGGSGKGSSDAQRPTRPAVRDISNVLDLRAAFNADRGKTRLLLLFSPT